MNIILWSSPNWNYPSCPSTSYCDKDIATQINSLSKSIFNKVLVHSSSHLHMTEHRSEEFDSIHDIFFTRASFALEEMVSRVGLSDVIRFRSWCVPLCIVNNYLWAEYIHHSIVARRRGQMKRCWPTEWKKHLIVGFSLVTASIATWRYFFYECRCRNNGICPSLNDHLHFWKIPETIFAYMDRQLKSILISSIVRCSSGTENIKQSGYKDSL